MLQFLDRFSPRRIPILHFLIQWERSFCCLVEAQSYNSWTHELQLQLNNAFACRTTEESFHAGTVTAVPEPVQCITDSKQTLNWTRIWSCAFTRNHSEDTKQCTNNNTFFFILVLSRKWLLSKTVFWTCRPEIPVLGMKTDMWGWETP